MPWSLHGKERHTTLKRTELLIHTAPGTGLANSNAKPHILHRDGLIPGRENGFLGGGGGKKKNP